jgi:hypothetical protein
VEGGRLARAIGTDQPDDLPGPDLEGEILDRGQLPIQFLETLGFDH